MAAISARNGEIIVTYLADEIFVGATGGGSFPPTGRQYETFVGKPLKGERGILVFSSSPGAYLSFFQYWWVGEKVFVENGIKDTSVAYCYDGANNFLISCRDWYYVTKQPRDCTDNYKVVDLFEMLRYIEGKIDLKELDHNARSYERRQKHIVRMAELQEDVERLQQENESLSGGYDLLMGRCEYLQARVSSSADTIDLQARLCSRLHTLMKNVLKASWAWLVLRHLPAWLRPKRFDAFLEIEKALGINS